MVENYNYNQFFTRIADKSVKRSPQIGNTLKLVVVVTAPIYCLKNNKQQPKCRIWFSFYGKIIRTSAINITDTSDKRLDSIWMHIFERIFFFFFFVLFTCCLRHSVFGYFNWLHTQKEANKTSKKENKTTYSSSYVVIFGLYAYICMFLELICCVEREIKRR